MTTNETIHHHAPFDISFDDRTQVADSCNTWLVDLIALALNLKQAHWNLRGARFKSVHEQLDEILVDVRVAVDDVAERIMTIGASADGRPIAVREKSTLGEFPGGPLTVQQAIQASCNDLHTVIRHGRECLKDTASDPITEDLVISVCSSLEKHHWMLESQAETS
jgi:starvation-inducible DNA-binding protein